MAIYTRQLTDITSGKLNPTRLRKEILDGGLGAAECIIEAEENDQGETDITIELDVTLGDTGPLFTIVQNHSGDPCTISRIEILNAVMEAAEQATQLPRLLDALDTNASVIAAMDNFNYILASSRIDAAVTVGDLLAEDKTLIESFFPVGWDS